ncbi:hypothetical protein AK812_SmicGene6017 [Symbiodinium microadriaticum]|uniref:Uncharacterized protein n=1 Tax=Symbiodinium microadriaticum TaxID=2951 RepID=A0A1Q9ES98_SYMMI|nr:hypothetical protein AK812_SmicGene6017 [Symbiodinium microadriaticum]CAE7608214.1 unnamed protein product [Symbiodinium microadriaticum]
MKHEGACAEGGRELFDGSFSNCNSRLSPCGDVQDYFHRFQHRFVDFHFAKLHHQKLDSVKLFNIHVYVYYHTHGDVNSFNHHSNHFDQHKLDDIIVFHIVPDRYLDAKHHILHAELHPNFDRAASHHHCHDHHSHQHYIRKSKSARHINQDGYTNAHQHQSNNRNRYLIMMASGVSRHQAELAVAAALVDYLQLERRAAVAATARREHSADTWNVSFSMEYPRAREEELLGQLRDLLASVEANVASTFSDLLRIQLEHMGAEPSGHLPLRLGVDGLGSVFGEEAEPADSVSIVGIALACLAASAMGLMAYFFWRRRTLMPTLFQQLPEAFRYVWQKEPSGVACDIWQLEAERWDLAESVLRAAPFRLAQNWRGVWQWDADEKGKKEEHRLYLLRFSPGGQFSGFGRGRSDFTVSGGAMDGTKGVLKWREQDLSNCILECAGHWDRGVSLPTRIDGTFSAYDVTALPKRIGQGCFTLTADAEGVPAAVKGEATAPAAVSDLV